MVQQKKLLINRFLESYAFLRARVDIQHVGQSKSEKLPMLRCHGKERPEVWREVANDTENETTLS